MSSALSIAKFDAVALSLTPEFHLLSKQALEAAKQVTVVTDAASQEVATNAASSLKRIMADLEKSRTQVKAPVLELGKKIDTMAKEAAAPLSVEFNRLDNLVKAHFRAEQEKARRQRAMEEALAEKRRKRIEAEAAAVAAKAQQAEDAGDTDGADQLLAAVEEKKVAAASVVVSAPTMARKAEKMTVRKVMRFKVENIAALYAARPELCSLEVKTAAINGVIAGGEREIPGLTIWEEDDVRLRA